MTFWIIVYALCGGCTLLICRRWLGWVPGTSTARKIFSDCLTFALWPLFWLLIAIDCY